MKTKKLGFSKKLLVADYMITVALLVGYCVCSAFNGIYVMETMNELISLGMDVSTITITPPFNLDGFGVFFSAWIVQVGVSTYAFYSMTKSEHKIELPIQLLETLPEDIKENIDMTNIITTVLTSTDN